MCAFASITALPSRMSGARKIACGSDSVAAVACGAAFTVAAGAEGAALAPGAAGVGGGGAFCAAAIAAVPHTTITAPALEIAVLVQDRFRIEITSFSNDSRCKILRHSHCIAREIAAASRCESLQNQCFPPILCPAAEYPSGPRGRIANPLFVGSNPTSAFARGDEFGTRHLSISHDPLPNQWRFRAMIRYPNSSNCLMPGTQYSLLSNRHIALAEPGSRART